MTLTQGDKKILSGERLQYIREQPRTYNELTTEFGDGTIRPETRKFIEKIKAKAHAAQGNGKSHGTIYTIYYIHGDERRAARKYVETNWSVVEECVESGNGNALQQRLNDYMWRLIEEEYRLKNKWDVP